MREAWLFLRPYFAPYRRGLVLGFGALAAKDLLAAALPVVIKWGVDTIGSRFQLVTLLWFCALLVALAAIKGVFQYWMRVILIGISRDIEYDLRNDLFAHLLRLSPDFYARTRTGDVMARATNDLNAVRMMLGPGVMYWFETSLTFALAVVVMAYVDWRLTVLALLPAPAVSIVVFWFGRLIHARFEQLQALFSDLTSRVQESLAGVRVLRAYVQEEADLKQFERLNRNYIAQSLRLARVSGLFMPLLQALVGLTFLIVLWVGGLGVIAGRITLGAFVMFTTYMAMLVWPMIALGWVINLVQRGLASLERIRQLLDERPAIAAPAAPRPVPSRADLEFRNVSVLCPGGRALDRVNLVIRAGETVAIVGRTGSGKTTLARLIPRLLDPDEGQVLWGGVDLREFDPAQLRRIIGIVPQETLLFSATLAENIAFGVEDASRERILAAARLAGLEPDLASFPQGLDTAIGERGLTLSGGQKQRTAIARAILRDPGILILDDALSSVDTLTEERILEGLAPLMRDRTTILISHRVSTVRQADRIVVLEGGRIVEEGSHAELLAANGYYADLYQKQLLEEELEAV
ncbi:MAG: ABC transporter ATP-binding protein [Bryobacterales bacterium]|nr:ABC transporter ATP-binding protein/permease [Bryobacteraceae bacterium]MDW8131429.1 ABC transporter ATP-binding protein [Bryobacterales bacterium]